MKCLFTVFNYFDEEKSIKTLFFLLNNEEFYIEKASTEYIKHMVHTGTIIQQKHDHVVKI